MATRNENDPLETSGAPRSCSSLTTSFTVRIPESHAHLEISHGFPLHTRMLARKIVVRFTELGEYYLMSGISDSRTSATLLERLRDDPAQAAAWELFVTRYGPMIHGWCRAWGAQPADASDVTQVVLVKLLRRMRTFAYDRSRSFRGWLSTVVRHAWIDLVAERRRNGDSTSGQEGTDALDLVAARDDFMHLIDQDHRREVLESAMDRVRQRVLPHTWHAFYLAAIEKKSGAEVVELLGISIGTVFQARNRVQAMIKQEIAALGGSDLD